MKCQMTFLVPYVWCVVSQRSEQSIIIFHIIWLYLFSFLLCRASENCKNAIIIL